MKSSLLKKIPSSFFALVAGTVLVLLGGCTSMPMTNFLPPLDTEFVVKEELSGSSGNRISIQNGEVLNHNDVERGVPNCRFRVQRPSGATGSFSIQPDTFVVTRVFQERVRVSYDYAIWTTHMDLSSDLQPEVNRMLCRQLAKSNWSNYVTIDEMIETLSPIVDLNLAVE